MVIVKMEQRHDSCGNLEKEIITAEVEIKSQKT